MRRLIYISRAAAIDVEQEIDSIVAASTAHNAVHGVTGMLWTDGSRFAQVLEGDPASIDQTMARIRGDRRHSGIAVICDSVFSHRMFGDWSMRRAGCEPASTSSTAFLVGYVAQMNDVHARTLIDIIVASEDAAR